MNTGMNIYWLGFRGCLYCGSLFPKEDGLCPCCSAELWRWSEVDKVTCLNRHAFSVYSLFNWYPNKQEVLSRVLIALKGEQGRDLWRIYAQEFWRRHLGYELQSDKRILPWVIIPSPSRSKVEDHASLFARGLAEETGATLLPCLARKNCGERLQQKSKNRGQRFRIEIDLIENFSRTSFRSLRSSKKVIFVDDVYTTGGTALAAWKTLGKPKNFTVWTLAQRASLAGRPSI